MILVDSSVWIDFFNGRTSRETDLLDDLLESDLLLTGDIILAEVLQGFRAESDFRRARRALDRLEFRPMLGRAIALKSAVNYRLLRAKGITVRKTIDMFIATFCIENRHELLHANRDFDPIQQHLGLRSL